ncbi:MAG TPA: hypothetical protein VFP04_03560 [Nitrospira sp.]|nr:hypothetical protein [Nitrospira sp.]
MGWVQDELKKQSEIAAGKVATEESEVLDHASRSPESEIWECLLRGFQRDIEEFQRFGGKGTLEPLGQSRCRISNLHAGLAVVVDLDVSARTIRYSYESTQQKSAIPEDGVLTIRPSETGMDLYSADQRLTAQDARQLILEPLLFPTLPSDMMATGT